MAKQPVLSEKAKSTLLALIERHPDYFAIFFGLDPEEYASAVQEMNDLARDAEYLGGDHGHLLRMDAAIIADFKLDLSSVRAEIFKAAKASWLAPKRVA